MQLSINKTLDKYIREEAYGINSTENYNTDLLTDNFAALCLP